MSVRVRADERLQQRRRHLEHKRDHPLRKSSAETSFFTPGRSPATAIAAVREQMGKAQRQEHLHEVSSTGGGAVRFDRQRESFSMATEHRKAQNRLVTLNAQ